jgi:hypothetical protein
MNQPLNPVLKADMLKTAPAKHPEPKVRQPARTVARLSMPENFALVEWLKAYQQQPGDTLHTITRKAAEALKNERINYNHVQQRMFEFNIPLPRNGGTTNAELIERLSNLEQLLDVLIDEQLSIAKRFGSGAHPMLQDYINNRALRRR